VLINGSPAESDLASVVEIADEHEAIDHVSRAKLKI
jgi:hypothetical protein